MLQAWCRPYLKQPDIGPFERASGAGTLSKIRGHTKIYSKQMVTMAIMKVYFCWAKCDYGLSFFKSPYTYVVFLEFIFSSLFLSTFYPNFIPRGLCAFTCTVFANPNKIITQNQYDCQSNTENNTPFDFGLNLIRSFNHLGSCRDWRTVKPYAQALRLWYDTRNC